MSEETLELQLQVMSLIVRQQKADGQVNVDARRLIFCRTDRERETWSKVRGFFFYVKTINVISEEILHSSDVYIRLLISEDEACCDETVGAKRTLQKTVVILPYYDS